MGMFKKLTKPRIFDIIQLSTKQTKENTMPNIAQNARSKIIGFIEDGLLDWEMVCRECLERMSTDEIQDMISECDWDDDHPCCM